MSASPCMTCGVRPKIARRHRCEVCLDRIAPIGEREKSAERRLAMVPEELRRPRVPKTEWPNGQRWCASCQSFVDLSDCRGSRCTPCASRASHSAMVAKTYGIDRTEYDRLFELQGGRCAICGQRPGKKKRLAVDHDHASGAVRGLLCGRCNHELLGAGFDSKARLWSAYTYLDTPPATGRWVAIADQTLPAPAVAALLDVTFATPSGGVTGEPPVDEDPYCNRRHYLPAGSIRDEEGHFWRIWVGEGDPPPF